jgi:hypothetical protein
LRPPSPFMSHSSMVVDERETNLIFPDCKRLFFRRQPLS